MNKRVGIQLVLHELDENNKVLGEINRSKTLMVIPDINELEIENVRSQRRLINYSNILSNIFKKLIGETKTKLERDIELTQSDIKFIDDELEQAIIIVEEERDDVVNDVVEVIDLIEDREEDVIADENTSPNLQLDQMDEETSREIQEEINIIQTSKTSKRSGQQSEQKTSKRVLKVGKANIKLLMRKAAYDAAKIHAKEDVSKEAGGILLGKVITQGTDEIVIVTGIVRAIKAGRARTSVEFSSEAWAEIWRTIDQHPEYRDTDNWQMVGWYHTHPGFGIFLSRLDLDIQENHFIASWQIALVIDPVQDKFGVFGWDEHHSKTVRLAEADIEYYPDDMKLIQRLRKLMESPPLFLPEVELKSNQIEHHAMKEEEHLQNAQENEKSDESEKAPKGTKDDNDIESDKE